MSDCIAWSYDARRAEVAGKKITAVQHVILNRSDPLVHTEFQFSERCGRISYSSTIQGGDKGCRFKPIKYSHLERWIKLILPMTDEQENRAMIKARELEGKEYDLIGLASFGTKWDIFKPDPDKYWCNEVVGELVKAAYEYGPEFVPHFYHPVSFFFEMFCRIENDNRGQVAGR